jgi:predicted Zn-ribbon and HTH transcriptional regulator
VIIPFRGYYEVQFLKKSLDFDDPYSTRVIYEYRGESPFLPLPKDIEERYLAWRKAHLDKLIEESERKEKEREKKRHHVKRVKCWNCGYEWNPRTDNDVVRCPVCRKMVRVSV